MRRADINIYIRDCSLDRAVTWAQSVVGPLVGPFDGGDAVIYHASTGSVCFTPGAGDGHYLGVWFNCDRPWSTDVDCARQATRQLGSVIRCEPDEGFPEVDPLSDAFLEIDGESETIISLNE